MNDALLIDEVLLSHCSAKWLKVARVLADAERDPRLAGLDPAERLDLLAARISVLFDVGRIDAEGDLDEWKFSEVRLAGPTE